MTSEGSEIPCLHENFRGEIGVARLVDEDRPLRFMVEVQVRCTDCGERFMFTGIDRHGYDPNGPSLDVGSLMLTTPIAPYDGRLANNLRYEMPS